MSRFLAVLAALSLALGGCAKATSGRHPWLVIGIDGGEWRVIERMWASGQLPHLRALADRGSRVALRTDYGRSPVIWTTIATGMKARQHGIEDFVVATPTGDVPVASSLRKVPALWNMLSRAGRRVAVVGWWASWPAEEVAGTVVSDRVLVKELPQRTWPRELATEVDRLAAGLPADAWPDLGNPLGAERDAVDARLAERFVGEGYDLVMVYLRSTDLVSHTDWRTFEPEAFGGSPASGGDLAAAGRQSGDRVQRVYTAVDEAIGRIVAAAPADTNVMVLSDHGFKALKRELVRVIWDLDALLQGLGFEQRTGAGVDFAHSEVYAFASPVYTVQKMARFALAGREAGATLRPERRTEVEQRLAAALTRVTFAGGEQAFELRPPAARERRDGADLVVQLRRQAATRDLYLDGHPLPGVILEVSRISGGHNPGTRGILLAAGPDVAAGADLEGCSIFDIAPSVLFGLGLPVGDDFAGKPWLPLFTAEFTQRSPLRRVATWGVRETRAPEAAAGDREMLEELRALGYLE